jgi:hypothetical protein
MENTTHVRLDVHMATVCQRWARWRGRYVLCLKYSLD